MDDTQHKNNSKCILVDCRPERKTNELLDSFQHVYTSLIRNLSQHGSNFPCFVSPNSWVKYPKLKPRYGHGAANLLVHNNPRDNGQLQTQFCNYVLHCANRDGVLDYVPKLGLESPTDNIQTCLDKLANKHKHRLPPKRLQLKRCETFLKLFHTGNFGPLILDDISKPYKPFVF